MDLIKYCCSRNIPIHNKKKHTVPWWTPTLTTSRHLVNTLRWQYQSCQNQSFWDSLYREYLFAKWGYQKEIRDCKFRSWKEFCNVEGKQGFLGYSSIKAFLKSSDTRAMPPTLLTDADGNVYFSSNRAVSVIMDYFFSTDDPSTHQLIVTAVSNHMLRRMIYIFLRKRYMV